jgi:hypothetical protein
MGDVYTNAKNMPQKWPYNIHCLAYYDVSGELYSEAIKKSTTGCMTTFIAWCRSRHPRVIDIPEYHIEDFLTASKIVFFKDIVFNHENTSDNLELRELALKLVTMFDAMVILFRTNDLVDIIHKEGITLAEQIAILSTHDDSNEGIFEQVGNFEELLRDYLLKFFPWREKNKSQIMKKNIRDTNYKFLDMIRINGEKKLYDRNTSVQALQREISNLRRKINSDINSSESAEEFPRILEQLDRLSATVLEFILGCGNCVLKLDDVNQKLQDIEGRRQYIRPQEYR